MESELNLRCGCVDIIHRQAIECKEKAIWMHPLYKKPVCTKHKLIIKEHVTNEWEKK